MAAELKDAHSRIALLEEEAKQALDVQETEARALEEESRANEQLNRQLRCAATKYPFAQVRHPSLGLSLLPVPLPSSAMSLDFGLFLCNCGHYCSQLHRSSYPAELPALPPPPPPPFLYPNASQERAISDAAAAGRGH